MDLTAGVALDTFLSDVHEITVGTDLGYYFSPSKVRGFQMSVGAEYNLMQAHPGSGRVITTASAATTTLPTVRSARASGSCTCVSTSPT